MPSDWIATLDNGRLMRAIINNNDQFVAALHPRRQRTHARAVCLEHIEDAAHLSFDQLRTNRCKSRAPGALIGEADCLDPDDESRIEKVLNLWPRVDVRSIQTSFGGDVARECMPLHHENNRMKANRLKARGVGTRKIDAGSLPLVKDLIERPDLLSDRFKRRRRVNVIVDSALQLLEDGLSNDVVLALFHLLIAAQRSRQTLSRQTCRCSRQYALHIWVVRLDKSRRHLHERGVIQPLVTSINIRIEESGCLSPCLIVYPNRDLRRNQGLKVCNRDVIEPRLAHRTDHDRLAYLRRLNRE